MACSLAERKNKLKPKSLKRGGANKTQAILSSKTSKELRNWMHKIVFKAENRIGWKSEELSENQISHLTIRCSDYFYKFQTRGSHWSGILDIIRKEVKLSTKNWELNRSWHAEWWKPHPPISFTNFCNVSKGEYLFGEIYSRWKT